MQPRSALFDQTIANAHTLLVTAEILSNGRVVASGLPVESGSVTGDRAQFARRTCSVVIGDSAYIPTGRPTTTTQVTATPDTPGGSAAYPGPLLYPGSTTYPAGTDTTGYTATSLTLAADLLAPYGNEIRLWRGAVTPAGPESICVGTFGIRSVSYDSGAGFKGITVTGIDRCKRIAETRFPAPRSSTPQVSAIDQVRELIWDVIPGAEIRVSPALVDATLPQVTWSANRDAAITDIMASLGGEIFCDPFGAFVLQPVPDPDDPPVITVTGGPGGVLVSAQHTLTRDGIYNGVIARSSTTSSSQLPVVSDLYVDGDPTSPTHWSASGFGKIVGFYDSSLLTSYTQANTAAAAMLANQIGAARSLSYAQLVNPALEPGDVGAVVDPDTGDVEMHLHDQVVIPLGAGGVMTAQTRSRGRRRKILRPYWGGALS